MREKITIATRASELALWQARAVQQALCEAWPHLSVELKKVTTTGDAVLDKPLHEIGDKALFTKELEKRLIAGEADMCVHSMKDVPSELPHGCNIAAMLEREDARDVLICGPRADGCRSVAELPAGSRIGTGSLRRAAQLRSMYKHIVPKPIRGNVDTRLKKAQGPEYDGVILAAAGVKRIGKAESISAYLPIEQMVPAVGQGAIGVEVRDVDGETQELVAKINDPRTYECVSAERIVLGALGGSCKVPVGVHIWKEEALYRGYAIVASQDGSSIVRVDDAKNTQSASKLAYEMLGELEERGAREILNLVLGEVSL